MDKKIRIGIIGSCATRDIFTTNYNKTYKEYFELIFSQERVSLISLFQKPINFDADDLKIYPENGTNRFRTKNLTNDFKKTFFEDFKNGIDYLIIDLFFESLFGILKFEDKIITNNTWDLPYVPYYDNLKNGTPLNIYEHSEEYFEIWKKYCDKLFEFLKDYPNVTVILNKINLTCNVINEDLSYSIVESLKNVVDTHTKYIKQFESYIEKNFDVKVIENSDISYTGVNCVWNPYVVHFSEDNYKQKFFELCKICNIPKNDLLSLEIVYLKSRLDLDNKIIKGNVLNKKEHEIEQKNKIEFDENNTIMEKILDSINNLSQQQKIMTKELTKLQKTLNPKINNSIKNKLEKNNNKESKSWISSLFSD